MEDLNNQKKAGKPDDKKTRGPRKGLKVNFASLLEEKVQEMTEDSEEEESSSVDETTDAFESVVDL